VEQADPGSNPFGNSGATAQAQPPAEVEEQFSNQSQSQGLTQTDVVPGPSEGNPFGEANNAQPAQPLPQEFPTAQSAAQPASGDPFSAAPAEISANNSVPMPVENDPRFGDFQPAPAPNQYEANPRSVPNELPSDVFTQLTSSQIAADGTNGLGQMQPSDRPEVYVVRPGDNYWRISKKQYGTVRYFMALARYNQPRIPDPKKMQPGMKVLTPARELLESRNPDLFPKYAANTQGLHNVAHQAGEKSGFFLDANGTPMYRVGPEDTLGGIALKHLGRFSRWSEIYQMNQHRLKNPNALSLGDVLELPADASRVSMVRHASGVR
jgi:nucleoid-associated protein YgaU